MAPMLPVLCCLLLSLTLVFGAPSTSLVVNTTSGPFNGVAVSGLDRWLGIPFAQPPVGNLRFKAPVPITNASRVVKNATSFGNACPQVPSSSLGAPLSEDCLFLNVFRPSNVSTGEEALPVLVWFYGGAFTDGAASDPLFDPTFLISRSLAIGKPIMFVSVNYRVNTFGFLASRFMAPEDLNAGLHDQRAALEYVQDNIANFGGDPAKVTIWGQSAGAGSVEAQVVFATSKKLFRAAMMDSATGPFKTSPPASTYDEPGKPYSRLVAAVGCPSGPASFTCLQQVPFESLLNVSNTMIREPLNSQLWQPAIGPRGSFAEERASQRIASGHFAHVPLLAGTNLNEGTIFSRSVLNLSIPSEQEDTRFDTFIRELLIDPSTVTEDTFDTINELYAANDTSLGGQFNTGDSLFDRGEAWYSDTMFLSPRRRLFDRAASLQPVFGYFFTEFIPGNDPTFGVAHESELPMLFGQFPAVEQDFATQFADFYVRFISDLDPGAPWPQFTPGSKQILQLQRDNTTVISDEFLASKTAFLNSPRILAQFQK
ncbi:alpha/beta-hydrolase [Fomes fomentarius]|nr:alpha/beta-hydrolase [Fomes fomentarius]